MLIQLNRVYTNYLERAARTDDGQGPNPRSDRSLRDKHSQGHPSLSLPVSAMYEGPLMQSEY